MTDPVAALRQALADCFGMPLVGGGSLRELRRREKQIPVVEVVRIAPNGNG